MNIGFLGFGNMATAMAKGISNATKHTLYATDINFSNNENIQVEKLNTNIELAKIADILFIAVKPKYYKEVLAEIKNDIENTIIISIAPGITLESLESILSSSTKIVRSMPNTPALVLEGMTGICFNKNCSDEDKNIILEIFNAFGKTEIIDESLMDTVVAVSGSSPAYVYKFIEAMADGAVRTGMPRDMAYKFAAQAVYGSAKMVLETMEHPAVLKDRVCSPGGTTIEAVAVLEKEGFNNSILEAMNACYNKSKNM